MALVGSLIVATVVALRGATRLKDLKISIGELLTVELGQFGLVRKTPCARIRLCTRALDTVAPDTTVVLSLLR